MSHVQEFAERVMRSMEVREKSWSEETQSYSITIREAVSQVFGDDPMGQVAFLVIFQAWNDIQDWCRNPHRCEPEISGLSTSKG